MFMSKRLKVGIYLYSGAVFTFSFRNILSHKNWQSLSSFPLLSIFLCIISLILIIAFLYDFKKYKDK